MTRHVAVTASLDPADQVGVDPSRHDDRFVVRFGSPAIDVLVTGVQLEALRISCGLALLVRSET